MVHSLVDLFTPLKLQITIITIGVVFTANLYL